ncbi:hypothetical protein HQ545_03680 [Candidatus Woesearchaeota archaeon]|nr:hypothetical protein [Candidatus Woesearchaeota archaeon]
MNVDKPDRPSETAAYIIGTPDLLCNNIAEAIKSAYATELEQQPEGLFKVNKSLIWQIQEKRRGKEIYVDKSEILCEADLNEDWKSKIIYSPEDNSPVTIPVQGLQTPVKANQRISFIHESNTQDKDSMPDSPLFSLEIFVNMYSDAVKQDGCSFNVRAETFNYADEDLEQVFNDVRHFRIMETVMESMMGLTGRELKKGSKLNILFNYINSDNLSNADCYKSKPFESSLVYTMRGMGKITPTQTAAIFSDNNHGFFENAAGICNREEDSNFQCSEVGDKVVFIKEYEAFKNLKK